MRFAEVNLGTQAEPAVYFGNLTTDGRVSAPRTVKLYPYGRNTWMTLKKRMLFAAGLLGLTSMIAAAQQSKPEEKPATSRTLKAKMNYTGAGTVDEKHKIFLFVFDNPDFMQGGSMPIASGSASAKDGTVTISDLTVSPIYIAVCYDPAGAYDGQSGPPPSGASMGVYTKTPPTPEPVKIDPGKTTEVTVPFDDSFKMP